MMAGEMRALSVRQPWAWAIAVGAKDVENRTRGTRYRGLLAIHASKTVYRNDLDDPLILEAIADREFAVGEPESSLGAVVAVVVLSGCHDDAAEEPRTSCSPWARSGQHHWMLAAARPLPEPVACKGALGLWRLPDDVEKAIRAQLDEDAAGPPGSADKETTLT